MSRPAPPWLRPHVVGYFGFRFISTPQRRVNLPSATVTLVLAWDGHVRRSAVPPREAAGCGGPTAVFGLHAAAVATEACGAGHGVQIELTPLGARSLFGIPMRHLSGTVVDPAELLGRVWVARLVDRLASAPTWAGRWAALDLALGARLADGPAPSPVVVEAWHRVCRSRGAMTVGELAEATGRSRRRLETLFNEHIGLPPKTLARVLRFQHAISTPWGPARNRAETAAMCGYHDQAHMAREFRAMAGLTAGQFEALHVDAPHTGRLDGRIAFLLLG
ncbi:helix-turn-helix domain-containing protein [Streptomyces agglomeratus]|uniref:helix-turn-helix domain-containing protein n=1 Tax=Streptomyces agglomeratus TaxID=285458 RepID=UPI00159F199F|nr:helix-turn-helix domain-containing protein [Streptomyces agglomeratus]